MASKRVYKPRKRKPKQERMYFTKVHEEAIVKYAQSDSYDEKNKLYNELIGPAINEMVDKIVCTFKFTDLPNIDDYKEECKTWLITILDKFDPEKGSKAFSYFSVITKNWFIHKVKKVARQNQKETLCENISKEADIEILTVENKFDDQRDRQDFWYFFWKEMDDWRDCELKENERVVLEAISILIKNSESIDIFNKKAVYFYLREITNLNTKQVAGSLKTLRQKYFEFKSDWNERTY